MRDYRNISDAEEQALSMLVHLIDVEGWEYPDAQYAVSARTGVNHALLQELYDTQFLRSRMVH